MRGRSDDVRATTEPSEIDHGQRARYSVAPPAWHSANSNAVPWRRLHCLRTSVYWVNVSASGRASGKAASIEWTSQSEQRNSSWWRGTGNDVREFRYIIRVID